MRMQKKESSDALFKLSCLSIWAVLLILFRIKLNTGNPVWRQKKENCTIPCCDEGSPSNTVARIFPPNGYPYPCLKYFRLKIGGIGGYYVPPLYRQSATLTPDNFTHKGKQGFLGSKWTKGLNKTITLDYPALLVVIWHTLCFVSTYAYNRDPLFQFHGRLLLIWKTCETWLDLDWPIN